MAETEAHKRAKAKAAGPNGQTEAPLPGHRRLDAESKKKATEVERSGEAQQLLKAAQRLRQSGKPQKVLQVPQKDMVKAADAMKKARVKGTVKNMQGS